MNIDVRSGVLAFGDSITNGGGELQWGVALQSWALWTARALGLPYTSYATDGARVADLVRDQLTWARERSADPGARYDLGCLHIGVNDVRALDWEPEAFAADLRTVVNFLAARCDRIVVLTIPTDLGRPRPDRARIEFANRAIEAEASRVGATIVDLRGFRGRRVLMADHVHPTALGHVAIAERVVDTLVRDAAVLPTFSATYGRKGRKDLRVLVRPSELVHYETTRWGRLRGDATYAYRQAKVSARELRIRLLSR